MPTTTEIQQYLTGAWRLMLGKKDGIRLLDVSADGFWTSFYAMLFALPPIFLSWVAFANDLGQTPDIYGSKPSIMARLLVADVAEWLAPIAALAIVARPLGIADRFVHYVVATNWATVVIVWITVPMPLARLFLPAGDEIAMGLVLGVFVISIVFSWRLTNATLDKGPGIATAVLAGVILFSVLLSLWLETALGLYVPEIVAG